MEQSYKEKYEQALSKAKDMLNYKEVRREDMEYLFPELAKSEDEKVRKALIEFFGKGAKYGGRTNGVYDKDILAWLEKQSEKRPEPYNGISFEYNGHIWGMCARDNGVDISCDKHLIKHLEKQAEQKPADKVEPKFKVGDKIYLKQEYRMPDDDTPIANTVKEIRRVDDKHYRFDGAYIFIEDQDKYELVEKKPADSYCQENCKGFQETGKCFADGECKAKREAEQKHVIKFKTAEESLGISSDEYNKIVDECLFGEQKLTEFERGLFDMLTDISNPCTADCVKSHSEKLLSIARKMIAIEQKPEENKGNIGGISPKWSVEDEENFCSVYLDVKSARQNTVNSLSGELKEQEQKRMDEVISWLRSLKGRVFPKQEWNEEDEQHIDSLLKCLDALCRNKFERTRFAISEDRDWLKSLKERKGGKI